jgi:hypothetical protein
MCKTITTNVEVDIDDFSVEEIATHLRYRQITNSERTLLKKAINDASLDTLDNEMKMDVILSNINKFNYNQICCFFEK